ncbi:TadE/TadG family type IV pilus assembly protein [Hirschia litorea]|uniref:TadE/TadG family type IV pilus assembly protein n=1 Tax=Hirschia litorea TaxID=1199156 RepID=A0ABW2IJS6_9PROT
MKKHLFQRFWKNKDGVAALEFALILPLIAILYFGTIEVSFLVESDRRVTATASTIADLVARTNEVNYCEIEDVFYASSRIIRPSDSKLVKLRVSSVVEDPNNGNAVVEWSQARGGQTPYNKGKKLTVDAGIMPTSGSVILAEVEYKYDTPFQYIIPSTSTLQQSFYLRPRQSEKVIWVGSTSDPGNC